MDNIEIIRSEVTKILKSDNSGHGMDHINRVVRVALDIASKENFDTILTEAIALLHDVDDYKLFGNEAEDLPNANMILNKTSFNDEQKRIVIDSIKSIGYSKRIAGTIPEINEAKAVSDADMIDAMGAIGILRSHQYNIKHDNPFFDRNEFPVLELNAEIYNSKKTGTVVNHAFEKILRLKKLMLTKEGSLLAQKRYDFVVEFLREYFYEVDALDWIEYLDKYISEN